jgi:molybdopterin synthase sulfur carrier subunit
MKILYFAWLREKTGVSEEDVDLPANVTTVAGLLDWLADRGPQFAEVLKDRSVVRVAVNQDYAQPDHPVSNGDEIALFPPVTGG